MFEIKKTFNFCYGHRLYKDQGKCGHVHGHTGRVEIILEGERLDNLGMLKNFDDVKQKIGEWIDKNLDHKMLLAQEDPLSKLLKDAGEKVYNLEENPTAENIAKLVYEVAMKDGLPIKAVTFWESPTASATYSK